VVINGLSGDATLNVDFSTPFGIPIQFNGQNAQVMTDVIHIVGDGNLAASYTAQASAVPGGTIKVGTSTLSFTGVSNFFFTNLGSFTFFTSGGNNQLAIDGQGAFNFLTGSTGGFN